MIKYALRCDKGHAFDSWFKDSKSYDRLAKAGALRCADCGSAKIAKQIMAPAIPRKGRAALPAPTEASTPAAAPAPPSAPAATASEPAMHVAGKMREALMELRRHVEKTADYVGPKFAEEARAMHYGDKEERSIYGEASDKEAEALREEGIPFGRMPWPKHKHDA